ncbi:hypothetical protein yberc0001_24890 [Yersinia bercovieri ATCC 43970]|uniref:Uncharacterized protein n=1 Tax=Yersinia bercovieri ATCC 43970 TaxID=349968 RepID=A0ABP2EAC2_YERBE|nr:hypothetical protein yberc0001_24890 [Yersinia bercovieri ATCC 43970]
MCREGQSIICINLIHLAALNIAIGAVSFSLILVINSKLEPFVALLYQIIAS